MRRLLLALFVSFALPAAAELALRHHGMRIQVPDLDAGARFYSEVLGFPIAERTRDRVRFTTGDVVLELGLSEAPRARGRDSVSFALLVHDLDAWIAKFKAAGVKMRAESKLTEGVGFSMPFEDPFGNTMSLLQQTYREPEPFTEPEIYNMGIYVRDVEASTRFYTTRLPFVARSRKYLPRDLPLGHPDGTFAFMLHVHRTEHIVPKRGDVQKVLLFATPDLAAARIAFEALGILVEGRASLAFRDEDGIVHEVVEVRD